ncbi:MAG: hypothetical protein CVU57_23785 [Deltaproteobacteria bacterium HGW-Deltaproteobacteria-15]|jgi:hypothetical protein|nr:MAG: hypothetical protein CVU57_23785 [Deltaproteobacteria bacterium HGW-Deltaproteobacteria-15]
MKESGDTVGEFTRLAEPIFIGGLFKSGTTLLRAMVGQHSAIASGLETQWFMMNWRAGRDASFLGHIERLKGYYPIDEPVFDRLLARSESAEQFVDLLLSRYALSRGKRRWVEKTPGNILHLQRIYRSWPDARVVHIIRDPRDVFASLKQAGKWDTVEIFADLWCEYLNAAEKYKTHPEFRGERFMELRYERLAERPVEAMREVLSFIGETWEPQTAVFEGKKDDFDKVLALTGKASTTLERLGQPLSRNRVGIWREIVTPEEIATIHRRVEEMGLLSLMEKIERESLTC